MMHYIVAGGSTMGRDHRDRGRNNQDAWITVQTDDLVIGIVADGCGSGTHNEVGARLGVTLLSELLRQQLVTSGSINWPRAQRQLLARLDCLATTLGGSYRQAVEDYLLFTLIGVVMTSHITTFFAVGDGVVAINGQISHLGPWPDNMPPYIGYNLLDGRITLNPETTHLRPWQELPTAEIESWFIGTDGVSDIVSCQGQTLPGQTTVIQPLSEFWENDRYISGNPDLLSRQLRLMARDWPRSNPEPGRLSDDTTIIIGRRLKGGDDHAECSD